MVQGTQNYYFFLELLHSFLLVVQVKTDQRNLLDCHEFARFAHPKYHFPEAPEAQVLRRLPVAEAQLLPCFTMLQLLVLLLSVLPLNIIKFFLSEVTVQKNGFSSW